MANGYPFLCIERKTMHVEKKDEKMKPNEKAAERKIAIYPWTINKEVYERGKKGDMPQWKF